VVTAVAFSPDGQTLLTGSGDNTARLWDTARGACLKTFEGHGRVVTAVAFSPDGPAITYAGGPAAVICHGLHDTSAHSARRYLVHGTDGPSSALFDEAGNLLDWDDEAEDTWLVHEDSHRPVGRSVIAY
jgi:WD40 repeat protein